MRAGGKIDSDARGRGVIPTKWFLDSLEKGKGGRTIVIWSMSARKLLRAKQIRRGLELVSLLENVANLYGFPEWIECEKAEMVAPLIQGWIQRHGIRVKIGPFSVPDMKGLIETFHYEQQPK